MVNMKLVERPNRSGFAQSAYDVIKTMDNKWLSTEDIHALLPEAMRRKHKSRNKLQNALTNGVERGLFVFVGESHGNVTNKKYRLATADHRERMMRTYRQKVNQWSKRGQSKGKGRKSGKPNGVDGQRERSELLRMIDSEIAQTEERLARLERMRNDALALNK
jgi:hypothetical protein